jgi:Ca2+-binding EF-hand superfamily protein
MWKGLEAGLKPLKKDEEERLRRVFDRIDKNADGYCVSGDLDGSTYKMTSLITDL